MESISKEEHMRLGRRYGNLAKSPDGLNMAGKLSAGCEKSPPMEAVMSAQI
jgi:hypothetical protein